MTEVHLDQSVKIQATENLKFTVFKIVFFLSTILNTELFFTARYIINFDQIND